MSARLLWVSGWRSLSVYITLTLLACFAGLATASASAQAVWTQQNPAALPPARYNAALAYDAQTSQLLLFGGSNGSALLSDTWTWDGSNWTQQSPTNSPSARNGAAMAYDAQTGQVVLFGGEGPSGTLSDTWTWNGNNWTQQSPATSPGARAYMPAAYDAKHGQVVLFGGYNGLYLNDTWTWDGNNWTQQAPASSPGARDAAAMAYDTQTGQTVLFGGNYNGSTYLSDTWTWDGSNWTQQTPANSPPARELPSIAYDTQSGLVGLFGGIGSTFLNDTWSWDGTNWTQQSPTTSPSARAGTAMAYDAQSGTLTLFGGLPANRIVLNDTWTLQLGPPPSTTTLTASANPSDLGDAITFTAVVTAANGTPTGTVTLYDGANAIGQSSLGNGQATFSTSALTAGTHTITAQYAPDAPSFAPSSGTVSESIISLSSLASLNGNNTFTGNQTINGTLTATTFAGNGSGLTGVIAAGLNCANCVTNSMLSVPYALGDAQGGDALNALALGGNSASFFAPASGDPNYAPATGSPNYLATTGGTVTGPLSTASLLLPTGSTATAAQGFNSGPLDAAASLFNSNAGAAQNFLFRWQAEPAAGSNNTANPAATLNLLYGANGAPSETGLSVNGNGTINFAAGQTFPGVGSGTITGVTAGSGLTGGGSSGNVSLNVNESVVAFQSDLANGVNAAETFAGSAASAAQANAQTYANGTFLPLAGGTLTGALTGTTGTFAGNQQYTINAASTGTVFNSAAVYGNFNNTSASARGFGVFGSNNSPSGLGVFGSDSGVKGCCGPSAGVYGFSLNGYGVEGESNGGLSAGAFESDSPGTNILVGLNASRATLFSVDGNGIFHFAAGQTFPGTGTINGVTAGTGLSGGGANGIVSLSVNESVVAYQSDLTNGVNTAEAFATSAANTAQSNAEASASSTFLPLAGGTLTGSLTGTTANFSGNLALSATNGSGTAGVITLGGAPFLHDFGTQNTFVGQGAGNFTMAGTNNTASGYQAFVSNTTGSDNTANGFNSLASNTTGEYNTALGDKAGYTTTPANATTTGSNNTFLGYASGFETPTQWTNATAIGANSVVNANNSLVLGSINGVNGATSNVNVGIGTATPGYALDVQGGQINASGGLCIAGVCNTTWPSRGVISFNGRSGAVTAAANDYSFSQIGGSVGPTQLSGSYSNALTFSNASSTFAGNAATATNALALGGLAASNYATTGANTFTATQTIGTGNLALPNTASSGTSGVITLGGNPFIHSYGVQNTFLGQGTGNFTMTGSANMASGWMSLYKNTTGSRNMASGSAALYLNTTGSDNTAGGFAALESNTTGIQNTASGSGALETNSTGGGSTAVGYDALDFNTSGNGNTAVGLYSGMSQNFANANTTGSFNTFIGFGSGPGTSTQLTNATAIGDNAVVSSNNALVLGSIAGLNTATASVNVGIGTATPAYALDVESGQINASGGLCIAGACKTAWPAYSFSQISGNVGATQLSGSYSNALAFSNASSTFAGNAATATTAAIATNALALGGNAPSYYATIGANTFTGTQTMPAVAATGAAIVGSVQIGGGTVINEYVSVTQSIALPAINSSACTTFTTAAVTGFTPGASDTISLGIPGNLISVSGVFLMYQAYEKTTTASPSITIQVCNPTGARYKGGDSGTLRIDIFKH